MSISQSLDYVWEDFLDKLMDVEQGQWAGEHKDFLRTIRKQFGSEVEDAYIDWWGENE